MGRYIINKISHHQKGNLDFKAKGTILSEEDAEKYIDLVYFFSEQAFKLYITFNPVEFNSIEPKNT